MTMRAKYRALRKRERHFEKTHPVAAFGYQYGGVLLTTYAAIQTVAVPLWGG